MSLSDLNRDALFSLELVVDRLVLLKNVTCRLPAIAFRLLDYPTLLIHLVEPSSVEKVRADAFACYPSAAIPIQLSQLMDGNSESFHFRHGKSCLLRMSPSAMRMQLSVTPLYISVIDVFPEVPKLVGSSIVPLEHCMEELYSDIVSHGVSVPTVLAESHEVSVSDLNGARLGKTFIRFRLLFLGSALLAHIHSDGLTTESTLKVEKDWVRSKPQVLAEGPSSDGANLATPIDREDLERPPKGDYKKKPEKFEAVSTQTPNQMYQNDSNKIQHHVASSEDIVISNMMCPPPLFYHSRKAAVHLANQNWSATWHNANTDGVEFMSDDGATIRSVDNTAESDEETSDDLPASKPHQKPALDVMHAKHDPTTAGRASTDTAKFPLLNALLAEILHLQGMNLVAMSNPGDEVKKYNLHQRESKMKDVSEEPIVEVRTAVEHESSRHRFVEAAAPKDIRQQGRRSSVSNSAGASHLVAGMTNTQRLRLSKRNPRLLQELEIQEARRRTEFKAALETRRKSSVKSVGKESMTGVSPDHMKKLNFTDEVRIDDSQTDGLGESLDSKKNSGLFKPPVPTPRMSKLLVGEKENEGNELQVDENQLLKHSPFDGTKTYSVVPRKNDSPRSMQSSTSSKGRTKVYSHADQNMRITEQSSSSKDALSALPKESHSDNGEKRQAEAFGVTRVLLVSSDTKQVSSVEQASGANVVTTSSVEPLVLNKPIHSRSRESGNTNKEVEEDLDCRTLDKKPGPHKGAEQSSDLVENGLDGLKQIIDRYSDDSRQDDGNDIDTVTGSQSARSYSSDSNQSFTGSSRSRQSSEHDLSTALRRIAATDYGPPIRPLGSQDFQSPKTTSQKGAQRQLDADADVASSFGVGSYSEVFEEPSDIDNADDVKDLKLAHEAKPVREAKLGYTWAP